MIALDEELNMFAIRSCAQYMRRSTQSAFPALLHLYLCCYKSF